MPRGAIFLIILALLLAGVLYFLASGVKEQPTRTIETDVTANAATN